MAKSDDPFEVFRRSKSYTYNRRPPSGESGREGEILKCVIVQNFYYLSIGGYRAFSIAFC